jgi:hypothetical protein
MTDAWTPQPHHCSTCRYWGMRLAHWNTRVQRTCDAPQFLYGRDRVQRALDFPEAAVAETWEGWGLLVGPDFGCVHWVEQAPAPAPEGGETLAAPAVPEEAGDAEPPAPATP